MKKALMLLAVLALVFSFVVGCSSKPADTEEPANNEEQQPAEETAKVDVSSLEDGTYHAEEADFGDSGWKYVVDVEVKDGKIVDATWNGLFKDGGDDKITQSKSGEYGMVENGGASAEWHEQAELVEKYLVEIQDPTAVEYTSEEGHADAITGASIHVKEFFDLATKALSSDPVK
ncbi:FMN-binding protein [Irregularibacter muris]|uniref:FMN-binding protein n=1 Tax=Irregularibacter muris TaxID=1796619 RepID=A0AAE3HG73_9FIRM|nr:FMN-binding protein [Irregularibacter muris]MCR1898882.1 FMN-binding protein [Irregularibacter muris]